MIKQWIWGAYVCFVVISMAAAQSLPGTALLTGTNDLTDAYLRGVDRFMLKQTERAVLERPKYWQRNFSAGPAEYSASVTTNRQRLAHILGVRDARVPFETPELMTTLACSAVLGETRDHKLIQIRWPVMDGFQGEGLLLEPKQLPVQQNIVHIPHAGVTPEQILGITPNVMGGDAGFARPGAGCRMVLPAVISRTKNVFESVFKKPGKKQNPQRVRMPNREFVYRPAYVMGRHIIGYEIQEVLALVDWFRNADSAATIRVEGWGDGGMLALYAGALDERIDETVVAGYFDVRNNLWQEPLDRNVFGLLREFGDAEIATLIAPRKLTVVAVPGPVETITREKGDGGAAGWLVSPQADAVAREVAKARELVEPLDNTTWLTLRRTPADTALATKLTALAAQLTSSTRVPDAVAREDRLIAGMSDFSQRQLTVSGATRRVFMGRLDFTSPEAYDRSAEWYRDYYREEIMGRIRLPKLPLQPRSRIIHETSVYTCYEVVLDVLPDFMLYGYLLIPAGIPEGEQRPMVVAQHGRGGTPRTGMSREQGGIPTYHAIGPSLVEKGYVVFLPQNPYTFEDRYRQLQRKANPLKLSLYSVIHAQYEQMFAWFKTLPQVDIARVAFIGQSYGGKTAVRVPPVMPEFCLAICTGDFNEGIIKMASTLYPFSFVFHNEYEIFEFDLGNTFNYSDLANLMAPRPFMAQRGHSDGVAWDEFVGYEYAFVRRAYMKLKLPERTEIDWFEGGHEIDLESALQFFDRFLRKP